MNNLLIRDKLKAVKGFLLDMDGTFYLGNRLLDGSLEFLKKLEMTGRKALFLTNNSSRSSDFYIKKLKNMGVQERFLKVLTSGQATARYVIQTYSGKKVFLLGNKILEEEMRSMGVLIDNDNPDYVIIAYDTELDYLKMHAVCNYVRSGIPYIATHPDYNCPTEDGFAPDIGAIIAFIKASTGREPDLIIGKPYKGIVEDALRVTGLKAGELAIVGDRLYTDIAAGKNFGMTSILVLSGEATVDDLEKSPVKPDLVFDQLSSMIPYLD